MNIDTSLVLGRLRKNWKMLLLLVSLLALFFLLLYFGFSNGAINNIDSDNSKTPQGDGNQVDETVEKPSASLPIGVQIDAGDTKIVFDNNGDKTIVYSADYDIVYEIVGDDVYFGTIDPDADANADDRYLLYKYSTSTKEYTLIDKGNLFLSDIFTLNDRIYYIFTEYMETGELRWFSINDDSVINNVEFSNPSENGDSESIAPLMSVGPKQYIFSTGWGDVGAVNQSFYLFDYDSNKVNRTGYQAVYYGDTNGSVPLGFTEGPKLIVATGVEVEDGYTWIMSKESRFVSIELVDLQNNSVTSLISNEKMPKNTLDISGVVDGHLYLVTTDSVYDYRIASGTLTKLTSLPDNLNGRVNITLFTDKNRKEILYLLSGPYDEFEGGEEYSYKLTLPGTFEVIDADKVYDYLETDRFSVYKPSEVISDLIYIEKD